MFGMARCMSLDRVVEAAEDAGAAGGWHLFDPPFRGLRTPIGGPASRRRKTLTLSCRVVSQRDPDCPVASRLTGYSVDIADSFY
jgi:hypothetical protein